MPASWLAVVLYWLHFHGFSILSRPIAFTCEGAHLCPAAVARGDCGAVQAASRSEVNFPKLSRYVFPIERFSIELEQFPMASY